MLYGTRNLVNIYVLAFYKIFQGVNPECMF